MNPSLGRRQGLSRLWQVLGVVLALAGLYFEVTARGQAAGSTPGLEPVFSPPAGYYDRDIRLEMSAPDPRAEVIFTVDGRVPTYTVGTVYTQPIRLSAAAPAVTIIRARVALPDGQLGPVVNASYFVGISATLPVVSLIVEPDDLWDPERGIYANPGEKGAAWERPVDVSYVDKDRRSGFHLQAGARIQGGYSRHFAKKSLRLYFRQEYGTGRLEYPVFADSALFRNSAVRSFDRLILHNGGQDWHIYGQTNWTLIRNGLAADLAFQVGGFASLDQAVLLFINGEPWGIYQLREQLDGRWLADHYGIESADFIETPELGGSRVVIAGDSDHWDHLFRFVEENDLADPANYAYVQTQVDIPAFIDYNVLQIYAANIDWPHHNVHQFRPRVQGGRWHWVFWDSDHGFGMYGRSTVRLNMMKRLLEFDHPQTGGRDVLLLRKLLENPAFLDRFLARTADLLNTTLSPSSVVAHIDARAAEMAPDTAYESIRWSSLTDWASNVQQLRDFARRRPDYVRQHMVDCFGLDGVQQIGIAPPVEGQGYVTVNDLVLEGLPRQDLPRQDLPWQGVYFQGLPLTLSAVPQPAYRFAGWDPPSLPQTPVITVMVDAALTITPRFEAVPAGQARVGDVVFGTWAVDDDGQIEGDWFELEVKRLGGVDLRGWRVTDNDTKVATDEGSLIFVNHPALARVPQGTRVRVIATRTAANDARFAQDDLDAAWDGRMVLYVANGHLDGETDPWFKLGARDSLVLLAPGATGAFGDERGIAFVSIGGPLEEGSDTAVTPASFGVLSDGVVP